MNLYLLTQDEISGYDIYEACLVAAETATEAAKIHPEFKFLLRILGLKMTLLGHPHRKRLK
jgi:hypothetical protein